MGNKLPFVDEQLERTSGSRATGFVCTKWNADKRAWHLLFGKHESSVHGSPRNAPLVVRNQGVPYGYPLGLATPVAELDVSVVGEAGGSGLMTGHISVAARKYRASDGRASEISPTWPRTTVAGDSAALVALTGIPVFGPNADAGSSVRAFVTISPTAGMSIKTVSLQLRAVADADVEGDITVAIYEMTSGAPSTLAGVTGSNTKVVDISSLARVATAGETWTSSSIVRATFARPVPIEGSKTYCVVVETSTLDASDGFVQIGANVGSWSATKVSLGGTYSYGINTKAVCQSHDATATYFAGGPEQISDTKFVETYYIAKATSTAVQHPFEMADSGIFIGTRTLGTAAALMPISSSSILVAYTTTTHIKVAAFGAETPLGTIATYNGQTAYLPILFAKDPTLATRMFCLRTDDLFVSTDSGATWTEVTQSDISLGTDEHLSSACIASTGVIFASTYGADFYYSDDQCQTFDSSSTPLDSGEYISSMCEIGTSGDVLAGTSKGRVLMWDHSETTWSVLATVFANSEIVSVFSTSVEGSMLAFAEATFGLGYTNRRLYKTIDGGATWFRVSGADGIEPPTTRSSTSDHSPERWLASVPTDDTFASLAGETSSGLHVYRIIKTSTSKWWNGTAWKQIGATASVLFETQTTDSGDTTPPYERLVPEYYELDKQAIRVSGLLALASDASFDDFDAVQVCITSSVFAGEWRVAATVSLETDSVDLDVDLESLISEEAIVPFLNYQFGGHTDMVVGTFGQNQNLIAFGQRGFDPRREGPVVEQCAIKYLRRVQDVGVETWVFNASDGGALGLATPSSAASLDGLRVAIYKGRQIIDLGTRKVPAGGGIVATGKVVLSGGALYLTELRGSMPEVSHSTGSLYRAEFRRGITASVVKNSPVVELFYESDGSPAYIAEPWMINSQVTVEGAVGSGTVIRVAPLAQRRSQYPGKDFFPSNRIHLFAGWTGETGAGLFFLNGDNSALWFGGSTADTWEGTSPKLKLALPVSKPIVAIGFCKGVLVAICAIDELVVIQSNGIFVPSTTEGFAGYDIQQDVATELHRYAHTCISASVANDAYGNLYWIGADGKAFMFDLARVQSISDDVATELFRALDPDCMETGKVVASPGHPNSYAIRFVGLSGINIYRSTASRTDVHRDFFGSEPIDSSVTWHDARLKTDFQFAFQPNRSSWLNFTGVANVDSACACLMETGDVRFLTAANGRLFLESPQGLDEIVRGDEAYTIGRINEREFFLASVPSARLASNKIVLLDQDNPPSDDYFLPFESSGLYVVKRPGPSEEIPYEVAEVLFPTENPTAYPTAALTLALRPLASWTVTDGESYSIVFGARTFFIEFPTITPVSGRTVQLERIFLDVEPSRVTATQTFPFMLQFIGSRGKPRAMSDASQQVISITQEMLDEGRFGILFQMPEMSREVTIRMWGFFPPDTDLMFNPIEIEYGEQN